jgi:lipoprotein NlpD
VLSAVILCAGLLVGCNSAPRENVQVVDRHTGAGVSQKPQPAGGQYLVQRGDTLYSIAFRFGWDWKALAARNNIAAPYVIKPGQVVRFDSSAPSSVLRAVPANKKPAPPTVLAPSPAQPVYRPPVATSNASSAQPAVLSKPAEPVKASPVVTPVKLSSAGWAWPAQGAVIGKFSSNGSLNKGIDIAGELGQPILAAQDGTVVYAGSGLRGYGELVIIKHSDVYVSAYGHNRSLLVREGQKVKAGQVIADMGSTGADRVKLHFEIRRQGKPVDPLQYLPSR